jgi:methylenetetrahydrofolate reductase (NADPH)
MRPAGTEDTDLGLESDLRAAVQGLLAGASLEITPTEAKRISSFRPLLEPGTRVYLTHVPGHSIEDTLMAATRLHNEDIVPVAHIAARRFPNRIGVESVLGRLRAAGCDEALVIAGGDASAAGDFSSALDLLATGALEKAGFSHIAVAGHPEGSPAASQEQLWHALNHKNAHALSSSAKFHVVSQFCFDAKTIGAWEKEARLRGNRLAIHVGVPGLTSVPKLLKYAALCGVGASASFLRHSSLNMLRLARWQPDTLICQLAQQALSDPASLIRRIHFFPFGAVAETVAWMRQVQRGNFRFRKDWSGLVVE